MRWKMSAATPAIAGLIWMAAFAPASVAATEATLAGAHAPGSEAQWAPSLRDPTAPLIRSQPASMDAPGITPARWRLSTYGFHHAAYERFCETSSASQLPDTPVVGNPSRRATVLRALGQCLSRR